VAQATFWSALGEALTNMVDCLRPALLGFIEQEQNAGAFAFTLGTAPRLASTGEFFSLGLG